MTAPLRPALQKFRTALNALYLEVEPSIANDIVDLANAAITEAEAYARAAAAESRKHNWKCVAPENGYYRWQCQNPGCSETAPYPSVLPDSSCAYSAALPVGESPAAAPQHEHRIYTSAVIRRGEKFLCIHHDSLGVWLFPGGKPKNGEPFLDCLIRECREELGITITSASFREAFINTVKGRQWAGLFYDVDEFEGEPHILEPQNHSALAWLSFDEMQQRATNQPEMGIASFCRAAAPAAPLPPESTQDNPGLCT